MRQSRGAGFLEYALLIVLIALVVIGAVVLLRPQNNHCLFCGISNNL